MNVDSILTGKQVTGSLLGSLFVIVAFAASVSAQAVLGTYTTQNPQGGTVTLVLQKDAQGKIGGSMSGNGASFVVEGTMAGDDVAGTLRDASGGLYFEAHRQGDRLLVILIEPGADGKPNFTSGRELTFTARSGTGPAQPAVTPAPITNASNPPGNPLANPLARGGTPPAPFAGTFTSADVVLTLKSDAAGYTGTLKYQGTEFPAIAKTTGQSTAGTFRVGAQAFDFTLAANGDKYVNLSTGGTTYMLVREAMGNPLAGGAAPTVAGTGSPVQGAATWKTYKHPVGLSLRYPSDWTLQEAQGFIQLTPPGVNKNAQGQATEVYLVRGEQAGGISSPEDPRVIQALEATMTQLFPFLQRTGGMERIKAGNASGILLTREGTNPQGLKVRGQVSAAIMNGFAVSILAVGAQDLIVAREKIVREIFASFSASPSEKDPQLVGVWQSGLRDGGMLIKDAAGRVQTTTASDSSQRYTLTPDGALTKISRSRTIVNAPGVSLDTGDQVETTRGTWVAGGGKLLLLWQDGSAEEWSYELRTDSAGSRVLLLSGPQGSKGFTKVQ